MNAQIGALKAEFLKNRYAKILWITFIAFGLAPVIGGVFLLIMRDPEAMAKASSLSMKAQAINFTDDWNSYFGMLVQAIGVGGVMVFGFVASWVFGREYSDGTAKDLLSLPISRTKILNAKFIIYMIWCLLLTISNLLIALVIGTALRVSGLELLTWNEHFMLYLNTTVMTVLLGTPIAFFAVWGKGYLAPLGFVALTLAFSQVVAAAGYGAHFPWSVPGLYSGMGGDYKLDLDVWSYMLLVLTSFAGYTATISYWNHADQMI